jgi:hypothetical protein
MVVQVGLFMVRTAPVLAGALALVLLVLAFTLALVALSRCEPKDVSAVVRALATWWRKRS